MKRFLIQWLVVALALWVTAYILPGVTVGSYQALAVAAIVLGLVNAFVRPVMVLLTLPLTILTFWLFLLVVNGLMLEASGYGAMCASVTTKDLTLFFNSLESFCCSVN